VVLLKTLEIEVKSFCHWDFRVGGKTPYFYGIWFSRSLKKNRRVTVRGHLPGRRNRILFAPRPVGRGFCAAIGVLAEAVMRISGWVFALTPEGDSRENELRAPIANWRAGCHPALQNELGWVAPLR
jgi:hypothetical protein